MQVTIKRLSLNTKYYSMAVFVADIMRALIGSCSQLGIILP